MAATKKKTTKKTSGKTGSARTNNKKQAAAQQPTGLDTPLKKAILSLVLFGVGIFLFITLIFDITGVAGHAIRTFLLGLFGGGAFLIAPFLIYIAFLIGTEKYHVSIVIKLWTTLLMVIDAGAMMHMVVGTLDFHAGVVGEIYLAGSAYGSGGICGGLLAIGLTTLFGKIGSWIVLVLMLAIWLIVFTGLTLYQLVHLIIPEREKPPLADQQSWEEESEKEQPPVPPSPSRVHKLRPARKKIDIPVDSADAAVVDTHTGEVLGAYPLGKDPKGKKQPLPTLDIDLDAIVSDVGTNSARQPAASPAAPPAAADLSVSAAEQAALEKAEKEQTQKEIKAYEQQIEAEVSVRQEAADGEKVWRYPTIDLLDEPPKTSLQSSPSAEGRENAHKLVQTLASFGVEANVITITEGPSITRYELVPAAGVKIRQIVNLADDLALSLAVSGVRIEAPIPGKAAVGIEIPNKTLKPVHIREILDAKEFRDAKSRLSVALGRDITGRAIVTDLAKMPHLLIAGATGMGKSVCLNTMIVSLLYKADPDEVKFIMIDPKMVEFTMYAKVPHLFIPVVTDAKKAAGALNWAVSEMLKRYKTFSEQGVRNIDGYNQKAERSQGSEEEIPKLCQIVIFIDELSDLMMAAPGEVEDAICRLAQMARAAGMYLVIATQRPSADVITGVIKANIPSRIALAVSSQLNSRIILDMGGAEKLIGKGDMLFFPVGMSKPLRVQGCWVSDQEIERVTDFLKEGSTANYNDEAIAFIEEEAAKENSADSGLPEDQSADALLPDAIECVVSAGQASTSLLQRRLKVGYARAARIMDEMEERGIIGPHEGSKPRAVLITKQQWQEMVTRTDE